MSEPRKRAPRIGLYAAVPGSLWRSPVAGALSLEAHGLDRLALSYCAEQRETAGVVPTHIVEMLGRGRASVLVGELVEAGRWVPGDGGYALAYFAEENLSLEEIEQRRESTAKRMREFRERQKAARSAGAPTPFGGGGHPTPHTPERSASRDAARDASRAGGGRPKPLVAVPAAADGAAYVPATDAEREAAVAPILGLPRNRNARS